MDLPFINTLSDALQYNNKNEYAHTMHTRFYYYICIILTVIILTAEDLQKQVPYQPRCSRI